ncbi:hypothetical protein CMUST_01605 [Corynebacterium mustelae]|uniref:Uncharacterized protein n=1 Tax=Corynebacterium mustelae TaxID=571915 RepID=A0A0G3GVY7_9CORY|nr:hypothetical protein [Corynebacterium mustelae]AKK04670.1 hypothetical protein CMUST_01605 [Corynebacterium mustelae]
MRITGATIFSRNTLHRLTIIFTSIFLVLTIVGYIPNTTAAPVSTFDVWVGATRVDTSNMHDVTGDGTVRFNPDTATLELNDATITDHREEGLDIAGIRAKIPNLTINVQGKNTITTTPAHHFAKGILHLPPPNAGSTLKFTGTGTLDITVTESTAGTPQQYLGGSGIDASGRIVFAGPDINATNKYQHVYTGTGIHAVEGLTVESGDITSYTYFGPRHAAGVEVETGTLMMSGGTLTAIAGYLEKPPSSYPGALAGVRVNPGNLVIEKGQLTAIGTKLAFSENITPPANFPIQVNEATSADGARDWDKATPLGAIGSPYKFVQIGSRGAAPTTTPTTSVPTTTAPTSTTTPPTTSPTPPPQSGSGSSALFDFLRTIIARLLQFPLLKALFGFLFSSQR